MLAPIRAIYLPLAHTASEDHPRLSAWVQVSFAQTRGVMVWRGGNSFLNHPIDSTYGLGVHSRHAVGFDVHGLMQLLALPRQLRNNNAYASRLIKIVTQESLRSQGSATTLLARYNISWLTVANANFGLDLQWVPTQRSNWFENFMKNVLTIAIGMIPVCGPILAIAFPVAWTLIRDPESAFDELKDLIPTIDLADRIIREHILKSVNETRQYLPSGWEQLALPAQPSAGQMGNAETEKDVGVSKPVASLEEIGMSFGFAMAGEILAKRDLVARPEDEPTDESTEEDGPGEVLVTIPPTGEFGEEDGAGSA